MGKHWKRAAALSAAVLTLAMTATTAHAGNTEATFEVTSTGSLAISVPASTVNLGSVTAGSLTFAPQLGTVTVTDTRAALIADWTATATGTPFDLQTTGATPSTDVNQRVDNTAITYTAVPTVTSGTGTLTPPSGTLALGATTVYAGSGSNTVTWNPTLTMTLLSSQVAGVYRGTITHSVS